MNDETEKKRADAQTVLRAIDANQAHGKSGARVEPPRAAQGTGLEVGSKRYHDALSCLVDEGALVGDEHTATEAAPHQPHGYAVYFFTERALDLLRED